jgi:hypothetical protein
MEWLYPLMLTVTVFASWVYISICSGMLLMVFPSITRFVGFTIIVIWAEYWLSRVIQWTFQ